MLPRAGPLPSRAQQGRAHRGVAASAQLVNQHGQPLRSPASCSVAAAARAAVVDPPQLAGASRRAEAPLLYLGTQRVHSLSEVGLDVVQSMRDWAAQDLMQFLKTTEKSWQPSDLLPDSASPDFYDQVRELRKASSALPMDYLVALVGDMVTEEALPSYMNMLNLLDGTRDETGDSPEPWAQWTRAWTAEEKRHGDLLNKYLYMGGRCACTHVHTHALVGLVAGAAVWTP